MLQLLLLSLLGASSILFGGFLVYRSAYTSRTHAHSSELPRADVNAKYATLPRVESELYCPKVYMYPLPQKWLDRRVLEDRYQADKAFPNPFGPHLFENEKGYHSTKHKSAPSIFENLLVNYGDLCLVQNPQEATIFFIPWYREYYCGVRGCDHFTKELKPEEQLLFSYIQNYTMDNFDFNYFQRYEGRDHFMLVPSEAATALIPKKMKWFMDDYRYITTFSGGYGSTHGYPFATMARFETGMDESNLPWRYQPDAFMKGRLVFMAFGTGYGIRSSLMKQCTAVADNICLNEAVLRDSVFPSLKKQNQLGSPEATRNNVSQISRGIVAGTRSSVFCVNIGSDFCSRRAFFDAIAMGCISIAFSHCPLEYYEAFIDMSTAVIILSREFAYRGLVEYLQQVPPWEIKRRQLYLATHGHQIQMSLVKSQEEFKSLSAGLRSLVADDAFFRVLRTVDQNFKQSMECKEKGGHYQPRYGVCCEIPPKGSPPREQLHQADPYCVPLDIVARGYASSCKARGGEPPCYFQYNKLTNQVVPQSKLYDPLGESADYLRHPIPYIMPKTLANFTEATTW
eukprot:Lankesteria_metandrocarpae@DN5283_c0_g1_i4.p1